MNNGYLESEKVSVFPCAYRGQSGENQLDPESRLNTERNATLPGKAYNDKNGYVISKIQKTGEVSSCEFSLGGYYFKLSKLTDSDVAAIKYANIKVRPVSLGGSSDYETSCLVNYSSTEGTPAALDTTEAGGTQYYFRGINFSTAMTNADATYSLDLTDADNMFPIAMNKISAGNNQSLADLFDGQTIKNATNATNVTDSIGSISLTEIFEADKKTAKSASNVTNSIGSISLTEIFEADKKTAKSATKLTSSAGSDTKPIYFNEGKPKASSGNVGGNGQIMYMASGSLTAGIKITSSTLAPSGTGNTGDIWITYKK